MKGSYGKKNTAGSDENRVQSRQKWLPGAVLAFFMLGGILLAFRDLMAGDLCLISAGAAGVLVILTCMGTNRDSGAGRIARLIIYGAGMAGFLLLILFVTRGFLDTVNRLITLWNLRFDTDGRMFEVSGSVFSSAAFWTLLAVPLSVFLTSRVQKRRMGLLVILLSASLLFAFAVGRSPGWGMILFFVVGILGAFFYVSAPGRILQMRGVLCMVLAAAAVFCLAAVFRDYHGLESLSHWKLAVRDRAEQLRYGEDSLPKGDLYRAQELLENEEDTLSLSIGRPQELYLRGFVGSDYQNDRWAPLKWEDYQGEYEGILEWLDGQNFVPMAQYAEYEQLDGQKESRQVSTVRAEVKNVGAYRKYVYLPNSVSSWKDAGAKAEKDAQFLSGKLFGAGEYAFEMIDQAPTAEKFLTPQWLEAPGTPAEEAYCDTESVYHAFVEDTYLETDTETETLIREEFFPEMDEPMDFAETTRQIRRVLRAKAGYTQEPLQLPQGGDMVSWFLEDAKAGNAVHFATAAVMAYRTAGYPARYVEGYHLTADEAETMQREDRQNAVLTGQNAHAWAEVYLFGAGWLPVEVTPGMYTESYTEQIVEGRPAYQIGTQQEDEGVNLEEGENRAGEKRDERSKEKEQDFDLIPAGLLLALYLLFALFLLFEAQRAVRIFVRRRKSADPAHAEGGQEAARLQRMLVIAGVKGNYDHPFELEEQIESHFPGVCRADYRRAVQLLQKEEFGGYVLRERERYALQRFDEKLRESLYHRRGPFFALLLRYWYALEDPI